MYTRLASKLLYFKPSKAFDEFSSSASLKCQHYRYMLWFLSRVPSFEAKGIFAAMVNFTKDALLRGKLNEQLSLSHVL